MNVIVFSKRHGRARQIELGRPLALTVTIAAVLAVVSLREQRAKGSDGSREPAA